MASVLIFRNSGLLKSIPISVPHDSSALHVCAYPQEKGSIELLLVGLNRLHALPLSIR